MAKITTLEQMQMLKNYVDDKTDDGYIINQNNLTTAQDVQEAMKNMFKDTRDIWMYTGYLFDVDFIKDGKRYIDNITDDILDNIDILVDGRFELDKKDITLRFKGSSNQRIIDVKESRKSGKVILSKFNEREPRKL